MKDIATRLSALPEGRILDYFWLMCRKGAQPLELLAQLGEVAVWRPRGWDVRAIRREFETVRRVSAPCFHCSSLDRVVRHHVIEIQRGGSNDSRNLVPLCYACHKRLHPWLTAAIPATGRRGFEALVDIAPRVVKRLRRTA